MLTKWLIAFICGLSLVPLVVSGQEPQVHEIAQIGRPSIKAIDWNPTQDLIAVATAKDIWLYDTQLEDVAHLETNLSQVEWNDNGTKQSIWDWNLESVKWSPDGKWILVSVRIVTTDGASQPLKWQIWDWDGNGFRQVLPDKFQFITKIEWNAAKTQFAVKHDDQVSLLNSTTNELRLSTDADDFAWNHAGTQIALAKSNQLEIIDTQNQHQVMSLSADEIGITQIVWSPDDTKIGAVSTNQLLIWDVASGKKLSSFESEIPNSWPEIAATPNIQEKLLAWLWLPDSKRIVVSYQHPTGSTDHIIVYSVETTQIINAMYVWQLDLSRTLILPQINQLISISYTGGGQPYPQVFDTNTWEILDGNDFNTKWLQSSNKQLIAGFSFTNRTITVHDASSLETIYKLEPVIDNIRSISWKPDNQQLVIASADELQIWNVSTQKLTVNNLMHIGDMASVIGWSQNNDYFSILSQSSYPRFASMCPNFRTWDTTNNRPLPNSPISTSLFAKAEWASISDQLLTLSWPGYVCQTASITIWNPIDGKTFNSVNELGLKDIAWAENDTKFSGLNRENWYLFDAQTGDQLRTIPIPTTATHVAWLPSDNLLLAQIYRYDDNQKITYSLDFIDATTGEILNSIPDVQRFSLASDQATIALYYETGSLEIWTISRTTDMPEYQIIRILPFNNSMIDLWWNPQSTGFATIEVTSSSADGLQHQLLKMWDLANLESPRTVIDTIFLAPDNITSFAWHPDGKSFATSQEGGIIKIWSLEPQ